MIKEGVFTMSQSVPKVGELCDGKLWFDRKDSTLLLGLTEDAVEEIGSVEKVDFPSEGESFNQGDVIMVLDGNLCRIEVVAPAIGQIQEVNDVLKQEPELLLEDPLEEGWLVKFDIQDLSTFQEFLNQDEEA